MAIPGQGVNVGSGPYIWAVETGIKVLGNVLSGGPVQSANARQTAALEAAGYDATVNRTGRGGGYVTWTAPDGSAVPRNQVVKIAKQLIRFGVNTSPPPPPPGVLPISPGRPPPRAGTPIPPKYPPPDPNPPWMQPVVPYDPYPPPNYPPPPPARPGTPDFSPGGSTSGGIGPIVPFFDVVSVLERLAEYNNVLGGVFDAVTRRPQAPIPKGPTNPRAQPGRGDPFPPQGPQVIKVYQMPQPPAPRQQSSEDWLSGIGLGRVSVTAKRVPVPKAPAPRAAPPPPKPLWQTLLPLLTPLLGLLGGGKNQQQRQVVNVPDPFGPGAGGDPRLEPQPSVIFGDIGGRAEGGVGSFTCECLPPKKKRRKKKRTVCYAGTYTERSDGTRKLKKRKVPCK